nr:uncharacterized protein LOC109781338 isoform X2 [Aegilops tauschii subsp. strangulata]
MSRKNKSSCFGCRLLHLAGPLRRRQCRRRPPPPPRGFGAPPTKTRDRSARHHLAAHHRPARAPIPQPSSGPPVDRPTTARSLWERLCSVQPLDTCVLSSLFKLTCRLGCLPACKPSQNLHLSKLLCSCITAIVWTFGGFSRLTT